LGLTGVTLYDKKVKNFHISWDNHLREKKRHSWEPIEMESKGQTVSFRFELEDGTVIEGTKLKGEVNVREPN
jgi:hypothetical protein